MRIAAGRWPAARAKNAFKRSVPRSPKATGMAATGLATSARADATPLWIPRARSGLTLTELREEVVDDRLNDVVGSETVERFRGLPLALVIAAAKGG